MTAQGNQIRFLSGAAALLAACVLGLVASEPAAADDPPRPEDVAAVSAYVELVPSSEGAKAPPQGNTAAGEPLPAAAAARLSRLPPQDAKQLERIATSPSLGAPERDLRVARRARTDLEDATESTSTIEAVSADASRDRMLGLAAALLAISGATIVLAARQRRSRA
jgi:hypothetical protein